MEKLTEEILQFTVVTMEYWKSQSSEQTWGGPHLDCSIFWGGQYQTETQWTTEWDAQNVASFTPPTCHTKVKDVRAKRETTYLYVGWNITLVTGALCPVNSYLQREAERSELNQLLNKNLSLDGNLSGGLGIQSVDSLVLRVAPKINRTQVPSQTQRLHTTLPAHTSLHHLLLHLRQLHF